MKQTLLILDVSFLCHRAFHVFKDKNISHEGQATDILFGVLRDIITFQEEFGTKLIAFCFDSKSSLRKLYNPTYKSNRTIDEELPEGEQEVRSEYRRQVKLLKTKYLPEAGFKNIFFQSGYEADDAICSVVSNMPKNYHAIVVSSDRDLFQLIDKRVSVYNPITKKMMTRKAFRDKYGIGPTQYADVLALAGCKTDTVTGIKGVGIKTAVKFLTGNLNRGKVFLRITKNNKIWRKNLPLVKLPYAGCKIFEIVEDSVTSAKWNSVIEALGIKSLEMNEDSSIHHNRKKLVQKRAL